MSVQRSVNWFDPNDVAYCITQHREQLLAFISSRLSTTLRQRVDPEDILQDVSLAAVRRAAERSGQLTSERSDFSWLCHLAEQRIIDAHRRHITAAKRDGRREVSIDATQLGRDGRDAGHIASLLAASITTASDAMERRRQQNAIASAINAMDTRQKEALRLRHVEGLRTRDIAAKLAMSDGAVRVLLSRALKRLQEEMDQSEAKKHE